MEKAEGITAANIAKELGASPAKVKKAIEELNLKPVAKKDDEDQGEVYMP